MSKSFVCGLMVVEGNNESNTELSTVRSLCSVVEQEGLQFKTQHTAWNSLATVNLSRITLQEDELAVNLGRVVTASVLDFFFEQQTYTKKVKEILDAGNSTLDHFTKSLADYFMKEGYQQKIIDTQHNEMIYSRVNPQNKMVTISQRTKSVSRLASKILSYEMLSPEIEERVKTTEGKQIRYHKDNNHNSNHIFIQDVYGVRMIVDDSQEWDYVYSAIIPFIERNFQIIDGKSYRKNGRFAGGKPKNNGYEAEHLNIFYSFPGLNNPIVIELQIRDKKADYVANKGSASLYHDKRHLMQFFN